MTFWDLLFGRSRKRRGHSAFQRRQGGGSTQPRPQERKGQDVTFTNDIALVKLSRRVRFSPKIQPVRLPSTDYSYLGYQAYVSGWGIQAPDQGPSPTLKGAELAVRLFILKRFDPFYVCQHVRDCIVCRGSKFERLKALSN